MFYTFSNLKRRLCQQKNRKGLKYYLQVKTTDEPRFTSSKEKSGFEVLQNCFGRVFDCIQLLDICSIFIQAFITEQKNINRKNQEQKL